jgi:hypothetical protein
VKFTVELGEIHSTKVNFTAKWGEKFHVQNVPFHGTVSPYFGVNFHGFSSRNPITLRQKKRITFLLTSLVNVF